MKAEQRISIQTPLQRQCTGDPAATHVGLYRRDCVVCQSPWRASVVSVVEASQQRAP
jgi:hypothetical protein